MDKQAALKSAQVLEDAQQALVSMAQERDTLATKCAMYERRAECTKVAMMLHDKGIDRDKELPELVRELEKEAEAGHLGEIARAADMIGPNMSFGRTSHDEGTGQGGDVLTNFLVGNVG